MSIIPQDVQQGTPREHNNDRRYERHVETVVSTVVSDEEAKLVTKKRKEKALLNKKQEKAVSRSGKKQKLCQVKDDIRTSRTGKPTEVGAGEEDAPAEETGGGRGGLFGGGGARETNPLTNFMFENAPVIIKLCQRSQEAMMKAQVAQTKEQMTSAQNNAKDTIAKGQAQANQQNQQAAGEFAQAGLAALQGTLQVKDYFAGDNTFAKNLDEHDRVLDGLNEGALENEANAAGRVDGEGDLSEEEKAGIDEKVKEFKKAHKEAYDAEIKERNGSLSRKNTKSQNKKSLRTTLKKSIIGLDRNNTAVERENELLSNRAASKKAYDKVFGSDSIYEAGTDADGNVTRREKFSDLIQSHNDGGQTLKSKNAQKRFMSGLFQEGLADQPPLSMKQRMNYIGGWEGENCLSSERSIRREMLKSYGSTKEGLAMSEKFGTEREIASQLANTETNLNQKILQTRNLLLQTLAGGTAKALTDFLQKQYMIAAANNDAGANLEASIGQMNSQAKGAEDSFVANSLKDMTGIFEWFQSLYGQLISAQTAAAGV